MDFPSFGAEDTVEFGYFNFIVCYCYDLRPLSSVGFLVILRWSHSQRRVFDLT